MSIHREIRLIEEGDGRWAATDEERGITARGGSRTDALDALDELVERTTEPADGLGSRLSGMAGDLDVDAVDAVRDVREHT
ncbi:hypothetical protein J2752_002715 [Halarchaeum rubridurum]|uniref:Type II toxin-antitoxin system HicB family antitoxin n=1 Tax=Halarchaeum rubridurum TaxID=489911 RepID=A0A830G436_9EURY|nr:type II toxin-antitoxin system HicB family antitoxin [Halarchaeum rubridurum]MBP1955786.1 hypothetical protein [Halarchaeum rubridurum]GGM74555.1 hypothetical protein GCM10009017_25640 [Halarchaeum rubridurum]